MEQWQVGPVPPEYLYSNQAQHASNEMHGTHNYQADMSRRPDFTGYAAQTQGSPGQPPHAQPPQQQQQQQQPPRHPGHAQHPQQQQHHPQPQHHQQQQQPPQQHHAPQQQAQLGTPVQQSMTVPQPGTPSQKPQGTPTQATTPAPPRGRKRPAPQQQAQQQQQPPQQQQQQQQQQQPPTAQSAVVPQIAQPPGAVAPQAPMSAAAAPVPPAPVPVAAPQAQVAQVAPPAPVVGEVDASQIATPPPAKKSRTNTPWTPAEELRLKQMRDLGNSWAEIAKTFPSRTEGSVKKHWYKDMHYAEFAEDESQALMNAIKEYENNKWKTIGQKVGKPAKACEQYAKEHFPELFQGKGR